MGAYLSLSERGRGWAHIQDLALINLFLPLGWVLIQGGH